MVSDRFNTDKISKFDSEFDIAILKFPFSFLVT